MNTARCLFLCAIVIGVAAVRGQSAEKEGCQLDFSLSGEIAKANGVVAYNPNGGLIAVAGTDDAIRIFSAEKSAVEPLETLTGHTGPILAMRFGDTNTLVSVGLDQTVKTWDVASKTLLGSAKLEIGKPSVVVIAPGGDSFIASGAARKVTLWDFRRGERLRGFDVNDSEVAALAFTPDGKSLVIGSFKGVVRVMDVATWKVTRSIDLDTPVHALAASADRIAVGYGDGTVAMLSSGDQDSVPEAKGHRGAIKGLAFSPDGRRFASASADQTAALWDVETLKRFCTVAADHTEAISVTFSPDGQHIAVCGADGTVRCWRVPQ